MELTAQQVRVLGCLIEKERTTPEQYPLTLNALRTACNQLTNREPVVDFSEVQIQEAIDELRVAGYTRTMSGAGMRTVRFRHVADQYLGLSRAATGALAVLALRGPQTAAEVRTRGERLGVDDAEAALAELASKQLAVLLDRVPGQSAQRWSHLLTGEPQDVPAAAAAPPRSSVIEELRGEIAELRARIEKLEDDAGTA